MSKKSIFLLSFVLILVFAANAPAAQRNWDGGGDPNNWNVATNWDPNNVPIATDDADIDINDANCIIDATAVCATLDVAKFKGPCYLNMTGGTLTIGSVLYIGDEPFGDGFFTMTSGTVNTGGNLEIGEGKDPGDPTQGPVFGTFTMKDGVFNVGGGNVRVGRNTSGTGTIYMEGGTLNIMTAGADLLLAGRGKAYVYMTGGKINIADRLRLGQYGGTCEIYLDGGTITVGNVEIQILGNSFIDINEGKMIVEGGASIVNELVSDGYITAYGGEEGVVIVDYNGTDTTVTGMKADPNCASNPNPRNNSTIDWTFNGPTLTWNSGSNAASHDVYFGTDFNDVNNADPNDPNIFIGNQPLADTNYSPGRLSLDTTYYWRIDEVNNLNTIWKGYMWQFTLRNYIIVDDMDEYGDDTTIPWIPGGRINYVWRDVRTVAGLGDLSAGNKTGSQIGHYNGLGTNISEPNIVRSGLSMPFYYENDGDCYSKPNPIWYYSGLKYYSEGCARTTGNNSLPDIDNDWTIDDVEALSLWFRGDPNNDPNILKMYVALGDADSNAVVYYTGDINDVKKIQWKEWNIPLSLFTGVTLTDVQRIYIGLGERGNVTTKSGKGIMYFDDIRLYLARCVPELLSPEADIDNDCDVDYDDLDVMTADWLQSDYTGKGHDGVLMNFPTDTNSYWVNDPSRGRCLSVGDEPNEWIDIDDNEFSNFQNKTIALWVKVKDFTDSPYIFCCQNAGSPTSYRIYLRTRKRTLPDPNSVRVHFVNDYSKDFNDVPNTWNHLAFVLRNTGVDGCTGEFYVDGVLIDQMINRPRHTGGSIGVNLGSFNDGSKPYLKALYDDFRVYDAALSAADIALLAGGGSPAANMMLHYRFNEDTGQIAANSSTYQFNRPLLSPAELYKSEAVGSRKVNFKDYAILAKDKWLEPPTLWP